MAVIAFGLHAVLRDPGPPDRATAARPGIHLLLSRLKHQGHRIVLASLEPGSVVRRVAHQLDLLLLFDTVRGSSPTRRNWAGLLEDLAKEGILPPGSLFISARPDEVAAAGEADLAPLGLGDAAALANVGAREVLASVEALDAWLGRLHGLEERLDPFNHSE